MGQYSSSLMTKSCPARTRCQSWTSNAKERRNLSASMSKLKQLYGKKNRFKIYNCLNNIKLQNLIFILKLDFSNFTINSLLKFNFINYI